MPESSTSVHRNENYDQLVNIICPDWSKPPSPSAGLEFAILPSSSHPEIQYDPNSSPPALGIPKTLALACFLHARTIFLDQIEAILARPLQADGLHHVFLTKRTPILEATAVMLVWEPTHLTAINWRRRALQSLLQAASVSTQRESGEWARYAECVFLESLLTSPMSQHAKSSMLWAYRLQLLRASVECHEDLTHLDAPGCGLDDEKLWHRELSIVMRAGERHPNNYHAWEYARQVYRLLFVESSFRDRRIVEFQRAGDINVFRETLAIVHQWCLMHPKDVSGWSFLASQLQRASDKAIIRQEVFQILEKTRTFVKMFDWKGASVSWFLRTIDGFTLQT